MSASDLQKYAPDAARYNTAAAPTPPEGMATQPITAFDAALVPVPPPSAS